MPIDNDANQADAFTGFSFQFNDTLNETQLRALATASFVPKGENILLVGGMGSGKTKVATILRLEAEKQGCRSAHTACPGQYSYSHGLPQEAFDCDLLEVDEVDQWFKYQPRALTMLLARRIELGKSNILVLTSASWQGLVDGHERVSWSDPFQLPMEVCSRAQAAVAAQPVSFLRFLSLFNVGKIVRNGTTQQSQLAEDALSLPADHCCQKLFTQLRFVPKAWQQSQQQEFECQRAFRRKSVLWHVLYTGEKNARLGFSA